MARGLCAAEALHGALGSGCTALRSELGVRSGGYSWQPNSAPSACQTLHALALTAPFSVTQVEFRMAMLRLLTWVAEMELWLRGESWEEAARDVGEAAAGEVHLATT